MYRTDRNNYHQKPKPANIQTPSAVSQFIFELLRDKFPIKTGYPILDPCYGKGNLLKPWQKTGYPTYGIEIAGDSQDPVVLIEDFLEWDGIDVFQYKVKPQLVLCNPPFNGYGNKLGSEVWLDKIIELFGKEIPIVLFTSMGFRLNSKKNGKRWSKFANHEYPPISSIISLPRDIFPEIEFHSEILIFNLQNLKSHYFFNPTSKIEQRTPI